MACLSGVQGARSPVQIARSTVQGARSPVRSARSPVMGGPFRSWTPAGGCRPSRLACDRTRNSMDAPMPCTQRGVPLWQRAQEHALRLLKRQTHSAHASCRYHSGRHSKQEAPMGHDTHFLSRLTRVPDADVELAMSLYRDVPLVRSVV